MGGQYFTVGGYPNPDPHYISPEEEQALEEAAEAAKECPYCDSGRRLVFHCKGICECGHCPDVEDCECCANASDVSEPVNSNDASGVNKKTEAT